MLTMRSVQVKGDRHLWLLMDRDPVKYAEQITALVLEAYYTTYQRKLKVRPASFIMEIWGHIYAEYYTLLWKDRLRTRWMDNIACFVRKKTVMIDIGERTVDRNRWFWDWIAWLKPVLPAFLPKNISRKNISGNIP